MQKNQSKPEKTEEDNLETIDIFIEEKLKNQDYASLEGNNWLNDDVINDYLKLINDIDGNVFMFSSYFHTAFREGGFKE